MRISDWIQTTIIIEFIIVFVIILIVYGMTCLYYFKNKRDIRQKNIFLSYWDRVVNHEDTFDPVQCPRKMDLLLSLVRSFNDVETPKRERALKQELIESALLPLARKKTKSRFSSTHLLCAQCFELYMTLDDEPFVLKLLNDKMSLVSLHAATAAIQFGSQASINAVIDRMSNMRRLGQSMYLEIFKNMRPEVFDLIKKRLLNSEKNPFVRATCYKLLMLVPSSTDIIDMTSVDEDLRSSNLELSLAALRFRVYHYRDDAFDELIRSLHDPRWEIRLISVGFLGELRKKEALKELEQCLKDPVYAVRMKSAEALKSFGGEGITILKNQNPNEDRFAFEAAMSLLNKQP